MFQVKTLLVTKRVPVNWEVESGPVVAFLRLVEQVLRLLLKSNVSKIEILDDTILCPTRRFVLGWSV